MTQHLNSRTAFRLLTGHGVRALTGCDFGHVIAYSPRDFRILGGRCNTFSNRCLIRRRDACVTRVVNTNTLGLNRRGNTDIACRSPYCLNHCGNRCRTPHRILHTLKVRIGRVRHSNFHSHYYNNNNNTPVASVPNGRQVPSVHVSSVHRANTRLITINYPRYATVLRNIIRPQPLVGSVTRLITSTLLRSRTPDGPTAPTGHRPTRTR